ncbi:YfhO family protein [Enterococcus rivorum]|uniref:Copper ABC transporter permease n=1 Tax=Enterococcus rivorum TaxID=762845 RepID=A0A1E5KSP5_9ENTE|nr:YfhO family protein [Enterococcus rivorum]MBP2098153.1 putative membrane protein YfhO [Enterococcus rivorum]OEH80922.1 copper ABC transporter permease [Enterococcus rivorum]
MIEKSRRFLKEKGLFLFLSIGLPILILGIAYYRMGIYLGSQRSIMASDAFPQLSNFYASYHNMLHGQQDIFYTWFGSLGLNYWSLSAYYLNGIFTPFVYFFDNISMPDTLYLLTLLKFGAIGGAFWVLLQQVVRLNKWLIVGLSISYALMGFTVAYSPMMMWLDGMMYLPLVILGIHRLMDQQKLWTLFLSYLFLFLSNFYIAFIIGVFSFLYYFARFFTNPKKYKQSLAAYFMTSFLAGGASMITILPTLLDLRNNGESLTPITQLLTPNTGAWDFIVKSMIGVYDTAKFESAPFIYVGIFPLLLVLFYFLNKKIPLRNKVAYGTLFFILIASVYIQPLNLFWHGLHAPNMLLFRFSFLYSFLVILLAAFGLETLEKKELDVVVNGGISLIVLFLAAFLLANKKKYDYFSGSNVIVTISFILVYLVFLVIYYQRGQQENRFFFLLMLLFCLEAGMNTEAMIRGVQKDWNYPARAAYTQNYQAIETLVNESKAATQTFYRMANLEPMSINESFNFGYSGVSMFSSIRNRHSSMYMNDLGFRSEGTNLTIEYDNNTLIMDALLGVRYNLAKNDPMKFGFTKVATSGAYQLYENNFALPLGILTDKGIYKKDAVRNQTSLLNYLSEEKHSFIQFTEPKEVSKENVVIETEGDFVYYSEETVGEEKVLNWTVSVPANTQAYLSLYAEDTAMMNDAKAEITVNGISREYDMKKVNQYYNLGYYQEATKIPVKVIFRGTPVIRILKPDVLLLDTQAFEKTIGRIQKKGVEVKENGRKVAATVQLDQEQVLLTTIPYDKGWTATIDGKKVEIPAFKQAFLTLPIPAGKHKIEFIFLPQGFKVGASLFFISISSFGIYQHFLKKSKKDQTKR